MKNIKLQVVLNIFLFTLLSLSTPTNALANIQSLNSSSVQNQSLIGDTNVTVTTNMANGTHTLGWSGQLPVSRGGTGASSFTNGSIPFISSGIFSQNNSSLFWDNTNSRLGVGTSSPTTTLDVNGDVSISGDLDLGTHSLTSSTVNIFNTPSLGEIQFFSDNGETLIGSIWVEEVGQYLLFNPGGVGAILDVSEMQSQNQTFTFPNASGTFPLLESDQMFTGLNKFEDSSNSTIYVGSSSKTSCIALGDSDGSGITYVTANDGVLTASTTKPGFCQ